MKIYISGPITHHDGPDPFGPIKAWLEERGHEVLNPKDVPACADKSCTLLPHEKEKNFEHSWACYLRYDLAAMLLHCDTILMLDGWQDSHGARLEMSTAAAVKMRILFQDNFRACLCNVGVQECPEHPGRLLTKEQKIQARKDWDARVSESGLLDNIILLPEPTRTQRIGSDWDPVDL